MLGTKRAKQRKLKKSSIVHLHMAQSSNTLDRKKTLPPLKSFVADSMEASVSPSTIDEQMKNDTTNNANIYEDMYFSNKPPMKPMTSQSTKRHSNFVSNVIDKMLRRGRQHEQQKKKKPVKSQRNKNNFGLPLILHPSLFDDEQHATIEFKPKLDNTYESINFIGGAAGDDDDKNEVNNDPMLSIHPSVLGLQCKYVDGVRKIEGNSNKIECHKNKKKLMEVISKPFANDDDYHNIFLKHNLSNSRRSSNISNSSWSKWASDDNIDHFDDLNNFSDSQIIITEEIRRLSKGSTIDRKIVQQNTFNTFKTSSANTNENYEHLNELELLSTSSTAVLGVYIPICTSPSEHSTPSTETSFLSASKHGSYGANRMVECDNFWMPKIGDEFPLDEYFLSHKVYKKSKANPKFKFIHKNIIRTCMSLKNKLCAIIN